MDPANVVAVEDEKGRAALGPENLASSPTWGPVVGPAALVTDLPDHGNLSRRGKGEW